MAAFFAWPFEISFRRRPKTKGNLEKFIFPVDDFHKATNYKL